MILFMMRDTDGHTNVYALSNLEPKEHNLLAYLNGKDHCDDVSFFDWGDLEVLLNRKGKLLYTDGSGPTTKVEASYQGEFIGVMSATYNH